MPHILKKKMNLELIDNFIDKDSLKELQGLFWSNDFPWFYDDAVNYPGDGYYQFTHVFYQYDLQKSEFLPTLKPILHQLYLKGDLYSLVRIKANLLNRTALNIEHGLHIDLPDLKDHHTSKTAIFYLNTNDGYTKFEDGTIIESVENRVIVFDSRLKHTGSTCTDEKTRVVINFNYF